MVYELSVFIPHHARFDLILVINSMVPAGIRLDLFNATAKRPDKIVVPLIKSFKLDGRQLCIAEVIGELGETMDIVHDERINSSFNAICRMSRATKCWINGHRRYYPRLYTTRRVEQQK